MTGWYMVTAGGQFSNNTGIEWLMMVLRVVAVAVAGSWRTLES